MQNNKDNMDGLRRRLFCKHKCTFSSSSLVETIEHHVRATDEAIEMNSK